jgi:thiamine pyrophosphokinase
VASALTALIVAAATPGQLGRYPQRPELVIAADGGLSAILAHGWTPDWVVGDLDSADPAQLTAVENLGVPIDRHPVDKDETDLELALGRAVALGVATVEVVVREDGRLDHQLANLFVLAHPRWAHLAITVRVGDHQVWVVRGHRQPQLPVGSHLALLAVGGPAEISARGLAYPLDRFVLSPFVGRGVANRVTEPVVDLQVDSGVVLAISSPRQEDSLPPKAHRTP